MDYAIPDADVLAMQRLAAGDDLALNEIMSRWKERLAAFLQRTLGDTDAAIDLAQETFVRLYQHCGAYAPSAPFPAYLFRIAANLARNHQRWQRRHPVVSLDGLADADHREGAAPASGESPYDATDSDEQMQAIEAAIAKLPFELREVILLHAQEDMTHAEIASVARCSVKAVESRLYRARQLLKALLAEPASRH